MSEIKQSEKQINQTDKNNQQQPQNKTEQSTQVKKAPTKQLIATQQQLKKKTISLIVYAGNLPLSWQHDDIQRFFSQYGTILKIQMLNKSGFFTGCALVTFKRLTQAQQAIKKLKGITITGADRPANIKWLDTQQQRLGIGENDEHKLFIGSLPRQATQKTLFEVFSIFGKVSALRLQQAQYWAFIDYQRKQSALLAIKYLDQQTYLHGSSIAIDVRFKQRKYNSFMSKKNQKQQLDPFTYTITNLYHAITDPVAGAYYYNYQTKQSQYQPPPPGAKVLCTVGDRNQSYIQQQVNILNDMNPSKRFGPPGSNLFLFHLPNNMKDSQLYSLFKKFGNVYSTKVMTQKNGKSKGIGFVSFDNPKSAMQAIEQMNGFQIRGKRLKVQLNKKDQKAVNNNPMSLNQFNYVL